MTSCEVWSNALVVGDAAGGAQRQEHDAIAGAVIGGDGGGADLLEVDAVERLDGAGSELHVELHGRQRVNLPQSHSHTGKQDVFVSTPKRHIGR